MWPHACLCLLLVVCVIIKFQAIKCIIYVDEAADKETYIIKFQAIKCIIMLKQQIRETYTSAKCRTWPAGECDSLVLLFMQA